MGVRGWLLADVVPGLLGDCGVGPEDVQRRGGDVMEDRLERIAASTTPISHDDVLWMIGEIRRLRQILALAERLIGEGVEIVEALYNDPAPGN